MNRKTDAPIGAYGMALSGVPPEALVAADGWPAWSVRRTVRGDVDIPDGLLLDRDHARLGLRGAGVAHVDRLGSHIEVITNHALDPLAIVHPLLSPIAMIVAHWLGRAAFHGAACAIDGASWILLGSRGAGKSTTTAVLAELGALFLADDLAVIDDMQVLAGPRLIDLRRDAAAQLGGEAIGQVGTRERWRLPTVGPSAQGLPLAGWIELVWSDDGGTSVKALAPTERLPVLAAHHPLPLAAPTLLALADRPVLRFSRPQDLAGARGAVRELIGALSAWPNPAARPAAARTC